MTLKEIIKKIVEYKNVRFINDRMFVAENGYLKFNHKVNSVLTEPKNKFLINNDEVKFLGSCEVLRIEVEGSDNNTDPSKNLFTHLQVKPLENIDNIKIINSDPVTENKNDNLNLTQEKQISNPVEKKYVTILDTDIIDLYKLNLNNYKRGVSVVKNSQSNNIMMGPRTSTFINLNSILPNTEYLFSIDGERLRGNGKFKIGFSQNNLKEIIFNERSSNFRFTIKTGNEKNDSVILLRPDSSLGSINIRRIVISEANSNIKINNEEVINNIKLTPPISLSNNKNNIIIKNDDIKSTVNNEIFKKNNDQISYSSKNNSILLKEKFNPNIIFDLNFTIAPLTVSSKKWINKILPFFPNVKIYNKIFNFKNIDKSNKIDLSICSIENVILSENIFLEEWVGEIQNSETINILNKSKRVFVNSVLNELELNNKLNGPQILRSSKIWPALPIKDKLLEGDYILYFEKDENITKQLLEFFNHSLNNFVVIGSRLKLPNNIIQYSEYEDYEKINNLIYNAYCLLDVSVNNNYKSAILDLAKNYNIKIITNNYHYINYDNFYLIKNYNEDSINKVLDKEKNSKLENIKKNDLNYNLEIKNIFCKMLGI